MTASSPPTMNFLSRDTEELTRGHSSVSPVQSSLGPRRSWRDTKRSTHTKDFPASTAARPGRQGGSPQACGEALEDLFRQVGGVSPEEEDGQDRGFSNNNSPEANNNDAK